MDTQRKIVYGLRRRALLDPDEDIRRAGFENLGGDLTKGRTTSLNVFFD